jgi:hypothetical protein
MPSTVLQPAIEPKTPTIANTAKIFLNMMLPIQDSSEPDRTARRGAILFVPFKTQRRFIFFEPTARSAGPASAGPFACGKAAV